MDNVIDKHPTNNHPFAVSLLASDEKTMNGTPHRVLIKNDQNNLLLEHMTSALQHHHVSPEALNRHNDLVDSLRIRNLPLPRSPYPQNQTTQKGNFAEIFLAEYLCCSTNTELPIYRLRYNTNPDQSMKGDDVLLFDLDSDPVRIIVGESKFRGVPNKQAVIDIVDGLMRSHRAGLPISLMFVSNMLYKENKPEMGKKIENCGVLFAIDRLHIDYVGLLMSNHNAKNSVNKHTSTGLHNLLMISLGMIGPEKVVEQSFARLEGRL